MDVNVLGFARALALGQPMAHGGFVFVPLYSEIEGPLNYIALQTAIESGAVKVEEVSESGSVGDLRITNGGNLPVLALDGEELAGAKQNRILNTTVLLARQSKTVIPVSCTEQGRWSYVSSREFTSSNSFAPPRIREEAKRAVNRSLNEQRGFRADQGAVWNEVAALAHDAGVHSPTSAMSDVVKSRLPDLDNAVEQLPVQESQCGLLAMASGNVLGFDAVSRPEVYARLHRRLLRSYMLEGATIPLATGITDALERADAFMRAATEAGEQRFKSPGMGDDLRYGGNGMVGSALVAEGVTIHMAFFRVPGDAVSDRTAGIRSYRTRMRFRTTDPHDL